MFHAPAPRSMPGRMYWSGCALEDTIKRWFTLALLAALPLLAVAPPTEAAAGDSTIAPLASDSLLLDGARAGNRLVLVGERGHVLLSDDNGDSWRQVVTPTRATLTAVSFSDALHGWAVGHDATILHSSDGGEHWQSQYQDIELQSPLLDVAFTDATHGLASGAYGLLLQTTDGGENWLPLSVHGDDDFHLNAIATDGQQHYLAAEAGMAYRNDGQQWQALSTPYDGSFFGVQILPHDGLLLLGLRGHLFRSDDHGDSWTEVASGSSNTLSDALLLDDGRLLVAGHAGTVLLSDDNGHSFHPLRLDGRAGLSALLQAANGRVLGIGEKGIHPIPLPPLKQGVAPTAAQSTKAEQP